MRTASGHQCKVEMSGSEKQVNKKAYDISSIKRVTKACLHGGGGPQVVEVTCLGGVIRLFI